MSRQGEFSNSANQHRFNLLYAINGMQADLDSQIRKIGVAGNASGIHGDVAPDGEILPHKKGNFSYDPPV